MRENWIFFLRRRVVLPVVDGKTAAVSPEDVFSRVVPHAQLMDVK